MAIYSPKILSLCSGYGGMDIAFKLLYPFSRTMCYVEKDAYAAATLVARMDDASLDEAPIWDDLTTFDCRPWIEIVDWVIAGYPCQPFSIAGKKRGVADPRHLWPYIASIISQLEPKYVFLENVPHHIKIGFFDVANQLSQMGYTIAAALFSAEEIGAPQARDRLFVLAELADTNGVRVIRDTRQGIESEFKRYNSRVVLPRRDIFPPKRNDPKRWYRVSKTEKALLPKIEPEFCGMADGYTLRMDRLRLCGNGVVPLQAAYALATLLFDLRQGSEQ